jgi:hypothetical protein
MDCALDACSNHKNQITGHFSLLQTESRAAIINDKALMMELTLQYKPCSEIMRWKPHIATLH